MTEAPPSPPSAPPPSLADSHPRLYHYTGEHAFKSIVQNNTLWGTYFDDLNDSTEFKHIRTPLAEELGERFIPVVEAFAKRGSWETDTVRRNGGVISGAHTVGKRLMSNLYKVTLGTPFRDSLYSCFVTSFCAHKPDGYVEDHGLLSQWRGTSGGPDGNYCLVFDTRRLEALIEEERQAYQFFFIGLGSAHYYKDRKTMPAHFGELVTRSGDLIADALAGPDFPVDGLLLPFLATATLTKHRGFEEESEVRLVAMPLSQLGDEHMKNAPGYKSLLLKTSFTTDINAKKKRRIRLFTERSKLPLERVIIGPARDQARNEAIAREVVGTGVEIVRSETPYLA